MKFTSYFATLATILALATVVCADEIHSCGEESDLMVYTAKDVKQDKIVLGEKACVSIKGILKMPLEKGTTAIITASLGLLTLYDATLQICEGVSCPISPGQQTIKICFETPSDGMSDVTVDLNFKVRDQNSKQVICLYGKATTHSRKH
ncbi:hypothetical protein BGZ65_011005 [Modicella reniformis]|uniref:Phosphatidylglycerol/phosphatidylinositol transfer protein n=1 Tax=Modicella reniformis TaxID=1440133 RepID=A0A9P6LTJ0_9FUNG|nr:hypothetical protein BGZ65_011005 [Modicella reniformis]